MIQGLLNHAGLTFNATLSVSKTAPPGGERGDWDIEPVSDGFYFARGKAGTGYLGRARVYPFCIKMKGTINVGGGGAIAGWKFGFIQSIVSTHRVATYAGGPPVVIRQNPVNLPVIDRDDSTNYFYDDPEDLALGVNKAKLTDEPNFEFKLVRKAQSLTEVLEDTRFLTFLAARNTGTGDIIVLGGYRWRPCYRATYQNNRFTAWVANEAVYEPYYAQVHHHVIPGAGGATIGDDQTTAGDNMQRLKGGQWEGAEDDE